MVIISKETIINQIKELTIKIEEKHNKNLYHEVFMLESERYKLFASLGEIIFKSIN